ncbi:hypothetical protein CKM354_000741900 [Cercospora kikuchii]|uniref:alpha-L-fucosidase n=1 Tax=Cercospora kikuchii TaxID=84275 RepID=A0A9P3CR35_9PEZI|nr:uncharacterized protein CKM354_000741900 [Cercospora kikuchii]GIZ44215.1 hypothetical protein CKM354_000741900 [Cercospora kikuchii]
MHLPTLSILSLATHVSASLYSAAGDALGISARSARGYAPDLAITGGVLTSKWVEGTKYTQIVEFVVTNNHPANSLTLADTLNITLKSNNLELVQSATLTRLAPKQAAVVQLGVRNLRNTPAGSTCSGTIVATYGQGYGPVITRDQTITGICGIPDYTADTGSLNHHWNPDWYNNVKFGIFIHWGLYSAPAFGNATPVEDYSEWYWCRQHDPNYRTKTYQYHEKTYGKDFNYDQFMANFTDTGYDPVAWVNLFAAAGARYMVPVTKHHDGFALFNTSPQVSRRSSMYYGPKKDLIGPLLAAAKKYQPHIRRGTYFSMPEWYNPQYAQYKNPDPNWAGGCFGADNVNPYTKAPLEYTGHVQVNDYVTGLQLPQMNELAYNYETELMWCDIGGANNATIFASKWLNWARDQGRQVTFNNRCGIGGDFQTPEYATNTDTVVAKWESNRGMDPFSFGYNYRTPDSEYLNGNDIVQSLVDIVSKNGNFLLDIGPKHDGSIPDIMQKGLRDAGSWIIPHGESIYDTRYWSVTPGKDKFRYTTTKDAFYIHYLTKPGSTITITDPVPWLPGDTVTVLGGSQNGKAVQATKSGNNLVLQLNDAIINGDKYVWTFKLAYTSNY